jgi:pimeloyl-ACP methyl ester carboxylesterase
MTGDVLLGGGRTLSRDGTEIGYLTLGPGPEGDPPPTLLCTHGAFSTGAEWLPVARLLADSHRLVLMDRRGHGCSSGTRGIVGGVEALLRESEDLVAVIAATAPPARAESPCWGTPSGRALRWPPACGRTVRGSTGSWRSSLHSSWTSRRPIPPGSNN